MASDKQYEIFDTLLCFHGPMLYEVYCLQRKKKRGKMQYFVHYKGWNKKWDEWVSEDRVLAASRANLKKMAVLKEEHSQSKKRTTKKLGIIPQPQASESKPKKRGRPRKTSNTMDTMDTMDESEETDEIEMLYSSFTEEYRDRIVDKLVDMSRVITSDFLD